MIDTGRLEEILYLIEELRAEALDIVRDSAPTKYESAYRGWSAEIQTALSSENYWIGQISEDTLQDTLEACEELNTETFERAAS